MSLNTPFINMPQEIISVTPIKLVLQKAEPYKDMYLHPYITNATSDVMDEIRRKVENIQSINLNNSALSDVSCLFLKPSPNPTGIASIENGWGTSRLKFQLEANIIYGSGAEEIVNIMGFTSYDGVNLFTKSIDPEMVFNINSINSYVNTMYNVNGVLQKQQKFIGSNQVLQSQDPNVNMVSMRPVDVIGAMEANYEAHVDTITVDQMADTRAVLNGQGRGGLSTRENNLPSAYMGKVISNYRLAAQHADETTNDSGILQETRVNLYENNVSGSQFMRYMTSQLNIRMTTWFKYSDLLQVFPGIDKIVRVITNDGVNIYNLPSNYSVEDFSNISLENQAANMIIQSVPSLMTKCFMSSISFVITNSDATGAITFIPTDCKSVCNIDMTPFLKLFEQKFISEVYNGISFNNYNTVNIKVMAHLHSDIYIFISINGRPEVPFIAPIFCDSLFTSVVSNNPHDLNAIAVNMDQLFKYADFNINPDPSTTNIFQSNSTF